MFSGFPSSSGFAGPSGTQFSPLGASLANASEAAHRAAFAHSARPNGSNGASTSTVGNGNGFATWASSLPLPSAGPGPRPATGAGDGSSDAPIDVDSMPAARAPPNPKKAVCIGGFMTRAIMLYPNDAAVAGVKPKPGQRWTIVTFKGAEMIHVKLRVSARTTARTGTGYGGG